MGEIIFEINTSKSIINRNSKYTLINVLSMLIFIYGAGEEIFACKQIFTAKSCKTNERYCNKEIALIIAY